MKIAEPFKNNYNENNRLKIEQGQGQPSPFQFPETKMDGHDKGVNLFDMTEIKKNRLPQKGRGSHLHSEGISRKAECSDPAEPVQKGEGPKPSSPSREESPPTQLNENRVMIEDYYKVAVENSKDGIAIVEKDVFLFVNQRFAEIFGYDCREELVGRPSSLVIHPDDQDRVLTISRQRCAGMEAPSHYEYKGLRKDGRDIVIEVSVAMTGFRKEKVHLSFHRDVSKRKRLEALLHQAQKMEAIGTMASGISHDFNNLLAVILGGVELSLLEVSKDSAVHTYLIEVLRATERATDLVQQILNFSRKKELERKPLQLSILCKEILKMLRATLPSSIEIQQDIDLQSSLVMADPTQIHQIIMNLCNNAAQAMAEKGGLLHLSLKNIDFSTKKMFTDSELEAGPYLELTVSDTGQGIEPDIVDRIFEPYFTTKKSDQGTGLGLAVVQGIVNAYEGAIRVSSDPGQGTTFQIYLPRIEGPEAGTELDPARQLPRGTERILLVDDDEAIVHLAKNMLEYLGYAVVTSTNSLEALEIFKQGPENFDLVLTDHIMPKLTGRELARRIHWINPDLPVIIFTGMGDLLPMEQKETLPIKKYLLKPLVMQTLAEKIRQVLDQ